MAPPVVCCVYCAAVIFCGVDAVFCVIVDIVVVGGVVLGGFFR